MSKRIEWLDIARGIGILLVVLGHALTTVIREDSSICMEIYNQIYFFHLPLLFYVSGLAFSLSYEKYLNMPFKDYLVNKFKRLMVPYLLYSLVVYVIFYAANSIGSVGRILSGAGYGKVSLAEWVKGIFIANNIYCQHIWYLYSLFMLSVFAFLCIKGFKSKYKYIVFIGTFLFWLFFRFNSDYHFIWKTALRGVWFGAGILFGIKKTATAKEKLIAVLSMIIIYVLYRQLWIIDIPITLFKIIELFVIYAIVIACVMLSQALEQAGDRIIKWLGKNSFYIYLFHQPFFGSGLGVVLYSILKLPIPLCVVVSVICCLLIPILIERVIKGVKTKYNAK